MRLVVLTAAYPSPAEPERAVYIETLCRALARPGSREEPKEPIALSVVAPQVHESDPLEEERQGIAVRRFRYPSRGKRLKEGPRPSALTLAAYGAAGLEALIGELRARSAETLLCHWVLPSGPIAAAASAMTGVPYAVVAHGSDINRYARASRVLGFVARRVFASARRVLAVSEALRRALVDDFDVPRSKTAVLPMGVDDGLFASRGACESRLSPPVLLFVGDVTAAKGVPELLEARESLARRGLDVRVWLAGDGPLRPREGDAGPAAPVRFVGRVSQASLAELYRSATLLVLPSRAEGAPVTVMEALACGLPVVASRVGGIPDLVEEGLTGWLAPPGDAAALAAVLDGLLRNRSAIDSACRRLREVPPDFSAGSRAAALRPILEEVARGV